MAGTTRTFIAAAVSDAVGPKLSRLHERLDPEIPDVHWTQASPFHLTLAFLGDVVDTDLNAVCRAAAEAAAGFPPFELRLEGLGAFPTPARPRVIWVGVAGPGLTTLLPFQKELARAVREVGYPPDNNRFHPHITVGRIRPGRGPSRDLNELVRQYQSWTAGSFVVAEAVVLASTLTPEGPLYAPLGRAPLKGEKRGPTA
jgi:2'-5' RNA ligase